MTKSIVILSFFVLSACLWAGVLINISLINSLIWPGHPLLPLPHGEAIANGTLLMASAILGKSTEHVSVHALRILLLTPILLPFCLFTYLHCRTLITACLKTRSLTPIKGSVATKTQHIANKLGVRHVLCVLDKNSNRISPSALIVLYHHHLRKIIVFTKRGLAFIEDHNKHAEGILAHEIAHLKCDCFRLWKLKLFSRAGLAGNGFLSVLCDYIAMEDSADEIARRYLRKSGKDENLLTEAVFMLEVEDYLDNSILDTQSGAAFSPMRIPIRKKGLEANKPLFERIAVGFRVMYELYFAEELCDYLHREAKYRRAQLSIERKVEH